MIQPQKRPNLTGVAQMAFKFQIGAFLSPKLTRLNTNGVKNLIIYYCKRFLNACLKTQRYGKTILLMNASPQRQPRPWRPMPLIADHSQAQMIL